MLTCLDTFLNDDSYRRWLIGACDDLDLSYDFFTSLSEVAEDLTTRQLERAVHTSYYGGIGQLVADSY